MPLLALLFLEGIKWLRFVNAMENGLRKFLIFLGPLQKLMLQTSIKRQTQTLKN